jgi:thiamine-phosphate pyrophosphorylase
VKKSDVDYSVYLVTDPRLLADRDPLEVIGRAIEGGATVVQYRDKTCSDGDYLDAARPISELCRQMDAAFIVNDRVHLVPFIEADGVHVGQEDMALADARASLGPDAVIGVSVSTVAEAVTAEQGGADYLGISPVFSTPSKPDTPPETGLAGLMEIRRAVALPLVGIGSVDASNAADVVRHGADGVAVIRAILDAPDPCEASRKLAEQVELGRKQRR